MPDEQRAPVFRAFGRHLPDEDREAHTPKNLALNTRGMELVRGLDILEQLRRVDVPTLVSGGELDPVTPVEAAEEVVAALPEGLARLEVIEGAGRFTWTDAPERYWPMLVEFIAGRAGGRRSPSGSAAAPRP